MTRAFLVVMDSVGIGGAPDAGEFFNREVPDTGANTVGHLAIGGGPRAPTLARAGAARRGVRRACRWPGRPVAAPLVRQRRFRRARTRGRGTGSWRECRCPG